ncbi:MAG: DoxX family protein [Gemmatimonadaceae bacterium]
MTKEVPPKTDAVEGHDAKSISRYFPVLGRVVMGLLFLVMGLNGFLNFLPQPSTPMPQGAVAFIGALMSSGYMLPLIAGTQVIVGVLLLTNRFVPLALALLAPVVVNILAFHVFLAPSGIGVAIVVVALEVYLVWAYRKAYGPMLAVRTSLAPRNASPFV